jgi:hypothetical protein
MFPLAPEIEMRTHITIVALMNIVFGALLAFGGVMLALGLGLLGITTGDLLGSLLLGTAGVVGGILMVAFALPQLIGGVGLLARQSWARYVLIVTSAIGLFKFPIGTALSVYALWVLFHDETKRELLA